MRDINRIDKEIKEIGELWKKVPDWRFSQLICNMQRYYNSDLFYIEDDRFLKLLKDFLMEVADV